MSKVAKRGIYILMVFLLAALGFAGYTYMNLTEVEKEKMRVEQDFSEAKERFQHKEKMHAQKTATLNEELKKISDEKERAELQIEDVERRAELKANEFASKIESITEDRDKWKRRIDTIKTERDQLMTKITELTTALAEKENEVAKVAMASTADASKPRIIPTSDEIAKAPMVLPDTGRVVDEQYWANLVQEKASLEVNIKTLNDELSAKSIELVEIKQESTDMKLEVESLVREKEGIEAELQHKSDMIDNISLELARTKNDKKFITNRVEKLNEENTTLRNQMKQLVSVKNALEKSIVRVTQEKDKVENQLGRTETLIQSKIDEIWDIKDEIDHSIKSSQVGSSNEVELPPIVVSSSDEAVNFNTGVSAPNLNGKVISINEPNNFVIVDLGENAGVRLGDNLSVYRNSKYIARLEVIQVRKDISAADLKDQWSKIQVGDVIR